MVTVWEAVWGTAITWAMAITIQATDNNNRDTTCKDTAAMDTSTGLYYT